MKIMLVNSVYKTGSTGKIVKELYNGLVSSGHQARVCYGRGEKGTTKNEIKICSKVEFYLHVLLARITGLNGYFSWFATERLIREIEQFQPDIVHLHNVHGYYINYFRLIEFLKKKKIKVVWTLHDELMLSGHCAYSFNCEKWKTGCGRCYQMREYPKSLLFDTSRYLFKKKEALYENNTFTIVTPSKWLMERVKESILKCQDYKVIHNGIDVYSVFKPYYHQNLKKQYNFDNRKIILSVTDDVNSIRKGIDYTLEIAKKCPEYTFIIVGGTRSDCMLKNVSFVDTLQDQNQLAEYYSMADVLLITSLGDNFPTVCIEALACGTPIVGFDNGGIAETAPISQIGLFVKTGDYSLLKQSLVCFTEGDRENLRKICREYAEANYSNDEMVRNYLKLYNDVLYKRFN